MKNIAVVGSRSFDNYKYMKDKLSGIIWDFFDLAYSDNITEVTIVSGGAKGADSIAEQYAFQESYPIKIFYPEWNKHGKAAGPIRNKQIVDNCDILVAFWDGTSRGTKNSIDIAKEQGKPVIIFKDWTNA